MNKATQNAKEAGRLYRSTKDQRLAVLIACTVASVGRGNKQLHISPKITQTDFAKESGIHQTTVGRYLTVWDRFAEAHPEYARDNLTPEDADSIEFDEGEQEAFDSVKVMGKLADIKQNPNKVREALKDPAFVEKLTSDPEVVEALVANHKVREAGYQSVTDGIEGVKKAVRKPEVIDDGRRPSEGTVMDGVLYMIETEEIDSVLALLTGSTQKVAEILRGGGLNAVLADEKVKAEAVLWIAEVRQRMAVVNATLDIISDVVNAGGVEDPDTAIAKLLG